MALAGANANAQAHVHAPQAGHSNYLIGRDPSHWRLGLRHYGRVEYREVLPRIDVTYYSRQGMLEYDLRVHPGGDVEAIRLSLAGVDQTEILADGSLSLKTPSAEFRMHAPTMYQTTGGARVSVDGGYALLGPDLVGFQVCGYDASRDLVIDPILSYSSYLGGSSHEDPREVKLDGNGNIYVAGHTSSSDFPTQDPYQAGYNGNLEGFIAKYSSDGSELLYATYLGGAGHDGVNQLVVDADGSIYATGSTYSADFPATDGAFDETFNGGNGDGFVVKLSPDGSSLVYATYLGGTSNDQGIAIDVNASGQVHVAGDTYSRGFPTTPEAYDTGHNGGLADGFVAKLSANGSALLFSTFLGGPGNDSGFAIDVDASGEVYVAGQAGPGFQSTGYVYDSTYNGGVVDVFVARLSSDGSSLDYSTFLGGNGEDVVYALERSVSGDIHISGRTASTDFPTVNAVQADYAGGAFDAYVATLSADGSALVYSTYIGGSGDDWGFEMALGGDGSRHVVGWTSSTDFPMSNPVQPEYGGGSYDSFVARLSADGQDLSFSTYLGGTGDDKAWAVTSDEAGNTYVVGQTSSSDYPTVSAHQPTYGGGSDGFLAIYTPDTLPPSVSVIAPNGGEEWPALSQQVIHWEASAAIADVYIEFSTDHGATWALVAASSASDGAYAWTVPAVAATGCMVRVSDAADGDPWDTSDGPFAISVIPEETTQYLIGEVADLVDAGAVPASQETPLVSKLEAVVKQLDKDNLTAAANQLGAFANKVSALVNSGRISPEDGQALIDASLAVMDQLPAGKMAAWPEAYYLSAAFPNPFNPETHIRYSLPEARQVRLTISDALGQQVATLIDAWQEAGDYEVTWHAGALGAGVYIYQIQAGEHTAAGRMLLVK